MRNSFTSAKEFSPSDCTRANQCDSLLDHMVLNGGMVSTIEAREKLGIAHPAGRFFELRKSGLQIETRRTVEVDACGRSHGCALYVLKGVEYDPR